MQNKIRVLMCGSDFSVGGGMVEVTKPYVKEDIWPDVKVTYIATHKNGNAFVKAVTFLRAYLRIWRLLLQKKIELAHLHTTFNGSFYRKTMVMNLCHRHGVKVILHHHNFFENFYNTGDYKRKIYMEKTFNNADLNIVLGTQLEIWMRGICPNARIAVVHNGVAVPATNPYNPDGKYIMFLGWFLQRKGIFDFLEVIKKVDDKIPSDIKFVLCGGEESEIADKINALEIKHRIAFIGRVSKEKRDDIFKETIINVLPSYNEGLPMTILETMSFGIPNIATRIAAIPDVIVDGVNGYLVEPGDVDMLSARVVELVNGYELREKMSCAVYESIRDKFNVTLNVKNIYSLYKSI